MYYGIVVASVVMFGIQFYLNDKYQKENGTAAGSVFTFSFISALVGVVCLFFINGFDLSATPFTLLMAFLAALDSVFCSICSLKALQRVNLSVYSLFSMLGGMMLPFAAGIAFYGEPMTLGKGICVVLVVSALLMTVNRKNKTGGELYYIGVFVLNGMSGVLSKIYEDAELSKVSSAGYSLWIAVMSVLVSGVSLICIRKKLNKPSIKAVVLSAGGGALNRVANFLLLIALSVLPASVQYPFVTGGVMIVSTVIAALAKQRPAKKEILAVGISFIAILALVFIPI